MASSFEGKFKLVSSDKFEDYMQRLGVGFALRKLANATTPTIIISISGDVWTIETHSTVKTTKITFKLGEEFEETTADGRVVKTVFTLEDGKLAQKQKHTKSDEKDSTIVRYIEGNQLITTLQVEEIVSKRVYDRI